MYFQALTLHRQGYRASHDRAITGTVSDLITDGHAIAVQVKQERFVENDLYRTIRQVLGGDHVGRAFPVVAEGLDSVSGLHVGIAWDGACQGFAEVDLMEEDRGEQRPAGSGAVDEEGVTGASSLT